MSEASRDLLQVARDLQTSGKEKSAHLSRAVSTVYYSLFHHLLDDCCDLVFWNEEGLTRARQHLKRSIGHKEINKKCRAISEKFDFPDTLVMFANTLVDLQAQRHRADYDEHRSFTPKEVELLIEKADDAVNRYDQTPSKHRLAFAVWIIREKKDHPSH